MKLFLYYFRLIIQIKYIKLMRHTITISGTTQIKNQRIHCKKLPNLQVESIVRIQQSGKKIYAIYTPDVINQNTQRSLLSIKYLQLNQIEEGLASISRIQTLFKLKSIQIKLSSIDYQLVNNNFSLLERSFLDQINIVWPGAKIPLYYNQCNFVTLIPQVKDIYLVDPYAAIIFNMVQQKQENTKQNGQLNDNQEMQLGERVLILDKIDQQRSLEFGYDNAIYLGQEDFNTLKQFKVKQARNYFFCTVEPQILFVKNPTFEQFQQFKKLETANTIPELKPILLRIQLCDKKLIEESQSFSQKYIKQKSFYHSAQEMSYSCSPICKISLSLPEKIVISNQTLNSFQVHETLSLEMFIKEIGAKKYKIEIQSLNSKFSQNQKESQLKTYFSSQFIKELQQKGQFIFFQNYFPFFINGSVFGLKIYKKANNKKDYEPLKNFLMIKSLKIPTIKQQELFLTSENAKSIIADNIQIVDDFLNQNVSQWLPTIKWLTQKKIEVKNQSYLQFKRIFQLCYKDQIRNSVNFIQTQIRSKYSSTKILFSTYSPNGKTYLHHYLCNYQSIRIENSKEKSLRSWYLDCRTLVNPNSRFQQIKSYLNTFIGLSPYRLVFLDNIDFFIPHIEQGDQMRHKQKIISRVLGDYLFELLQSYSKVAIFTAKSQANIDPTFKFDKNIKLKNPNRQLRQQIIQSLNLDIQKSWIQQFADKSESLSLGSIANYLIAQQIPSKNRSTRKKDFNKIVGLSQAKQLIRTVIEKPNKFGFIYDKVKIKIPRAILLYGATGNGKTALGNAVQDEFSMKFFTIKGSDILSKYIGGSQAAVRQIFQKALSVAPSIIFFDEFQSIVPRRNSSGTGVTDRVVNQFLCYLDGISSTTGIFIIAASSRPDLIDPALLRPGRIDSHIYLDYPNEEERSQLLKMFQMSVKLQISEQEFVQSTYNFSYSDLIGLLKQLRIKKSAMVLREKQNPEVQDFKLIPRQLFDETIKCYKIGTSVQQQLKQKQLFEKFKLGKGAQIKNQKFIQM